jgi:hypothetical protein
VLKVFQIKTLSILSFYLVLSTINGASAETDFEESAKCGHSDSDLMTLSGTESAHL